MAAVADLVAGKSLEALYAGLEELIGKNLIYKSLFIDLRSKLKTLEPLIKEMVESNQQLERKKNELEGLEELMKGGLDLVANCSKLRKWNIYKKYKYANKLIEFEESLQKQLDVLKVQMARDLKKTEVAVENVQAVVHNIQAVVDRIDLEQQKSTHVEPLSAVPELPALTVGLDGPLAELKAELLKDEVSMLVVTAPGGCGKTTLAIKFCQDQDIKDKFKTNIFFVTVSKSPNLEAIMKELHKQKGYEVPTLQSQVNPMKWLQRVQKDKGDAPLLLVLDDVWSGSEELLEKFEFEMSNYKILVTSRSEFQGFRSSSYRLQLLDGDNAMKLFHHAASLGNKSSHIPNKLAKEIVKRCNGFPLAITVTGRSLCGRPIEIWRSRVIEWSKGNSILDSETELLLSLKSILDALNEEMPMVKKCFLDLGVFPEDSAIQVTTLIDMWTELYDMDSGSLCMAKLYELNNRNLANLSQLRGAAFEKEEQIEDGDYSDRVVKQHDLLRELAIYHSRRDSIEKRERLIIEITGNHLPKWWSEQKYQPLKALLVSITTDREFSMEWPHMELPRAEVLVLNFKTKDDYVLPEFVERMEKLKMLVLISYGFFYIDIENFQLLESLSSLRTIRIEGIDVSCITKSPVRLKNLQKLYLRDIRSLGNGSVKLSHVFPDLQEMVLDWNSKWEELPAEICELTQLTKLTIVDHNVLSSLPEAIGNLVNLEVLRIRFNPKFLEVSEAIGNLNKLKVLEITGCNEIEKLPEQIGELKCLTNLSIMWCPLLSALPEAVGKLVNLEVLNLRYCTKLLELPESIGNLQKLSFLDIEFCKKINELPETIGNLADLEVLNLRYCVEFLELPESIGNLQKLNILDIYMCKKIKELPEQIGELKSLRKLNMSRCLKLRTLPESVSNLDQLEEVICEPWDATNLWTPLLPSFKNLRIMVYNRKDDSVRMAT